MIYCYVIPYKPNIFVQTRMDLEEAQEILEDLRALSSGVKDSKITELLEKLDVAVQAGKRM